MTSACQHIVESKPMEFPWRDNTAYDQYCWPNNWRWYLTRERTPWNRASWPDRSSADRTFCPDTCDGSSHCPRNIVGYPVVGALPVCPWFRLSIPPPRRWCGWKISAARWVNSIQIRWWPWQLRRTWSADLNCWASTEFDSWAPNRD